eukprot:COSAG01_NODE_12995_length_1648_cov_2.656572_1_plen_90_part_00
MGRCETHRRTHLHHPHELAVDVFLALEELAVVRLAPLPQEPDEPPARTSHTYMYIVHREPPRQNQNLRAGAGKAVHASRAIDAVHADAR